MEDSTDGREAYVRRVLAAYRLTPGTSGHVRCGDRRLAGQLYDHGVQLDTVENAFVLAAARRLFRPPGAVALSTIRSLHYFLPVVEEVAGLSVGQDYFRHLRGKIERHIRKPQDR